MRFTWRYRYDSSLVNKISKTDLPKVVAFWHGDMLIGWDFARKFDRNYYAVVSPSRDGKFLADFLSFINYNILHGSSNKSSKELLASMVETLKLNNTVAITPDGPKGPAFVAKPGATISAIRSGALLIALNFEYQRVIRLKSWDKFAIPLPFSIINIGIVEIDLTDIDTKNREQVDKKISELSEALS